MNRIASITQNKDFKRAYYQGKYKAHPLLVTYLVRNRVGFHRVGVVTSKKVGKAHQRNRAKRIMIAAYREIQPTLGGLFVAQQNTVFYDIVLMARPGIVEQSSTALGPILRGQLEALLRLPVFNKPHPSSPKHRRPPQRQAASSKTGKPTRTNPSRNERSSSPR